MTRNTLIRLRARWSGVAGVALVCLLAFHLAPHLFGQAQSQQAPQQPTDIEVVIGGDAGTPPRYAVPDFVAATPDATDVAKTISQVLWDDLDFEKEFYLIARDTYSTVPQARTPEQVPFASW